MSEPFRWSERQIAAHLARVVFDRKCLLLVPNCSWPGNECDLLAVTNDLRVIDVEVKISRADFRADHGKGKWWRYLPWDGLTEEAKRDTEHPTRKERRLWPGKVWKHYYCLPESIWKPEMAEQAGSPASGILLIRERTKDFYIRCERRATPNREANRLEARHAIDIARLASLRMWDAYGQLDAAQTATV